MKKKLSILITTGLYPPEIGGPATYSKLLYDEFPKHRISVKVLPFRSVRGLPRLIRHIAYFFKIIWYARGVDVVYAQDPVSVGFPAMLASKILRKKFLLKIVGDYAWEQYQISGSLFVTLEEFQIRKFDNITEKRRSIQITVAKNADRIIVPSKYLKKIIMMWGAKEEKISVVYNSFEDSYVKVEKKDDVRARVGIDGFVIISAGRLVPWKGFMELIEIMPDIMKSIPSVKLYIAGDGPDYYKLNSRIADLGLQEKVFLLGRLEKERLNDYIKSADVFVLNTGYEGLSHQVLEVMSLCTPIITTNVGGNSEVIEDGKEGALVEYKDKTGLTKEIVSLYEDKDKAALYAKNAKNKLSFFGKEKMISETIKALDL